MAALNYGIIWRLSHGNQLVLDQWVLLAMVYLPIDITENPGMRTKGSLDQVCCIIQMHYFIQYHMLIIDYVLLPISRNIPVTILWYTLSHV